jgi:predicted dehydrogenase
MTRPLKAGVIGVGLAGGPHIEAIGRTGMADVAAVAASSEESARRAADRFAVPSAYGDWHGVVEDPAIDVVHNCTPNHLHAEVARAALAAGKHLITEKPLATNLEDASARRSGRRQPSDVGVLPQLPQLRDGDRGARADPGRRDR